MRRPTPLPGMTESTTLAEFAARPHTHQPQHADAPPSPLVSAAIGLTVGIIIIAMTQWAVTLLDPGTQPGQPGTTYMESGQ